MIYIIIALSIYPAIVWYDGETARKFHANFKSKSGLTAPGSDWEVERNRKLKNYFIGVAVIAALLFSLAGAPPSARYM